MRKGDDKPAMADFMQLREMLAIKQNTYIHKSGSQYSISKVLGMFEPQPEPNAKGGVTNNLTIVGSTILGHVTAGGEIDQTNR